MKWNRKFTGMLLAGAMIAGIMAMPAGATADTESTTPPPPGVQYGETVEIKKVLTKDEEAYAPTVKIGFTVAPAEPDAADVTFVGTAVYEGDQDAITDLKPASFAPSDGDIGKNQISETASFKINPNVFDKPGVYKYTITENAVNYPGMSEDANPRTLYVYVNNNQKYSPDDPSSVEPKFEVFATGLVLKTENDITKSEGFENRLTTYNLTVEKEITGTAANLSGEWIFNVEVTGQDEAKYLVVKDGNFDEAQTITGSGSVPLGNGGSFTVYGLSEGDTYTVTEVGANGDGYTTTITGTGTETGSGVFQGVIGKVNATVSYVNDKDQVAPTGLLMDIAPYAAMLVLAAAAAFVFLRRRTNED